MDNTIDYNLVKQMFKLQDEFNEYTTKDWRNANLAWHRAIWLECGEAVDSLDWKWWKHKEPDMENFKVELVDIWHFLMSFYLVHFPDVAENPEKYEQLFEVRPEHQTLDTIKIVEDLAGLVLEEPNDAQVYLLFIFTNLWAKTGKTFDELYNEYIIKNVLNKFRQDNGYKTGEYIKMWTDTDGVKVEDNVIAWKIAGTIKHDEFMFNNLSVSLNDFYSSMNK